MLLSILETLAALGGIVTQYDSFKYYLVETFK